MELYLVDFWHSTKIILLMSLHIAIQFYFIYVKFILSEMNGFFFSISRDWTRVLVKAKQTVRHCTMYLALGFRRQRLTV